MLFKGTLGTALSGSVGGVVASHHGAFGHFQARSITTNRNSESQQSVRNAVSTLTSLWVSSLTAGERDSWVQYSTAVLSANRLGDPVAAGGLGAFVRSNVPRLRAGLAIVTGGPGTFNRGTMTAPIAAVADAGLQSVALSITNDATSDPWAHEVGSYLLVFGARPQNAGHSRLRGSYRFASSTEGNPIPPGPGIIIPWPFGFAAGQRLFGRCAVSYADGRYTSETLFTIIAGP